jgi:hypothetical protein
MEVEDMVWLKYLGATFVSALLLLLVACASVSPYEGPIFHSSGHGLVNSDLEGYVVMSITEIVSSTATVIIHNNSELPILADNIFGLEVYDNAYNRNPDLSFPYVFDTYGWLHVPPIPSVEYIYVIETTINPHESYEFNIDLQNYMWAMDPGLYRITTFVALPEWEDMPNADGFHSVFAEFVWD